MYRILFLFGFLCLGACHRVGQAIESGAETAGKAAGSIAQHVGSGVEQAFELKPELSPRLSNMGLQLGKTLIGGEGEGTHNKLSVYFIATRRTDVNISARVNDVKGQEAGRTSSRLQLDSGQARYLDFLFDKYTNMDSDSRIYLDVQ